MPVRVIAQHVRRVIHRIGGDRDELHKILHRTVVDRGLNRRDLVRMERADIRAVGVDEMKDDHLVPSESCSSKPGACAASMAWK